MEKYISKALIKLRKSKKLSQSQFGKLLGMSRSKISSWEVGRRDISISDAVIVCDYFDMSLDNLLNPHKVNYNKIISMIDTLVLDEHVTEKDKERAFNQIGQYVSNINFV